MNVEPMIYTGLALACLGVEIQVGVGAALVLAGVCLGLIGITRAMWTALLK